MLKKMLARAGKALALPVIVYALFLIVCFDRFSNWNCIYTIFLQSLIPTVTAYAVAYGMIAGIFDFSVGARLVISALCGGLLSMNYGMAGLIIGCFGSSILLALITGLLNNVFRIPSLVLTMGLAMIFEIVGARLAGNYGYVRLDSAYSYPGSVPHIIILSVLSAALFYFILDHTRFSYHMRAVGSNELVAKNSGVKVAQVKLKSLVYGSIFLGMAAFLSICQSGSVGAQTNLGSVTVLFKPMISIMIALVLQNLCNLTIGIFISQLSLNIIFIGLIAMGMPDTSQNVVLGFFLLLVMVFSGHMDSIRAFFSKQKTRKGVSAS